MRNLQYINHLRSLNRHTSRCALKDVLVFPSVAGDISRGSPHVKADDRLVSKLLVTCHGIANNASSRTGENCSGAVKAINENEMCLTPLMFFLPINSL